MPDRPPPDRSQSGGSLLALGAIGGAGIGFAAGQPTIGLLIGLALGVAGAIAIWWRGRG